MTAEVAIFNKSAVALAADSAVTLGGEEGKVYNTVNKLFALSKGCPVGVMVYANADYMGVPFETVIKMFRKAEPDPEGTIEQYATKLARFLGTGVFSSKVQQESNVANTWRVVFEDMAEDIGLAIQREIRTHGDCSTSRQKQIFTEVLATHYDKLAKFEVVAGFEKVKPSKVVAQYTKQYQTARDAVFGDSLAKAAELKLQRIAGLAIVKDHEYSTYSGVVVAGFGEDEIFPHYVEMRMHGTIAGTQKCKRRANGGIRHDGTHALVRAFAQRDMVGRFMEGVDNRYNNFITGGMVESLRDLAKGIIDVHVPGSEDDKNKIRAEVEKLIRSQSNSFRDKATAYRRERFVDPVLEVVVGLPKEELANLAEALVNLTSIKRRVSTEKETVGGPIDVAVISKGDGFIWIKRKHYFRPELNLQFVANLLNPLKEVQ